MMKNLVKINLFACLFLFGCSSAFSQTSDKGFSDEGISPVCDRLDVTRISNVPNEILSTETVNYITGFVDNPKCNDRPIGDSLTHRAVDMAYIVGMLAGVDAVVSGIGYAPKEDFRNIKVLATKQLESFSRSLEQFPVSANARDMAVRYYLACQKSYALSFERCPEEAFSVMLSHYNKKFYNKKLSPDANEDIRTFIKGGLGEEKEK